MKRELKWSATLFAFALFVFLFLLNKNKFDKGLKSFDPYEILQVNIESTDKEIRKAFKNLARTHHPDRNHNDPNAHKTFIILSKAYNCIKDEKARQ